MKEKIKIPIDNIILKKENIIDLARCLAEQEDIRKISFGIKFMNEQEIESDDIIIFENQKFNEYEIKNIHMSYFDKEYTKSIEVWIYNYGKYSGDSNIEISYENKEKLDWLAVTEKEIKEQLSYCSKRSRFISFMQNETVLFYTIAILSFFASIFAARVFLKFYPLKPEIAFSLVCLFFIFLLGSSINWRNLFYKAFPKVEIDIKEKSNRARKARKRLEIVLSSFIIPIILDIILSIVKKFIGIN